MLKAVYEKWEEEEVEYVEHSMRSEEGCCPTYTSHHFADDCRPGRLAASSSASVSSLVGILPAVAAAAVAGVVVGGAIAVVCGESLEAMADGLSSAVG